MADSIVVLVPVWCRPHRIPELAASFAHATTVPYRLLFLVSTPEDAKAADEAGQWFEVVPDHRYAPKINHGYRVTNEEFLLCGADDICPHRHWDTEALKVAEATGAGVVGTNDLGNPTVKAGRHSTHPVVRRSYADLRGTVDGPGQVVCEAYWHNWCDTELVETAKARGAWAFAADSHVEHKHPFWKKGEDDEVYALGREHYAEDARLYRRRQRLWMREKRTAA